MILRSQLLPTLTAAPCQSPRLLIEARNLSRRAPGQGALLFQGISLSLYEGDRLALRGPSGAGKSVILRALALLDASDDGEVLWQGAQIAPAEVPNYRQKVIYLQQRSAMLPGSVADNLRLPFAFAASSGKSYQEAQARSWFTRLGRSDDFLTKNSRDLSGGEAQLVALVRALQLAPQVLLLDEATSALDLKTATAFHQLLTTWVADRPSSQGQDLPLGRAMVWVTHDEQQLVSLSNREINIAGGCIK